MVAPYTEEENPEEGPDFVWLGLWIKGSVVDILNLRYSSDDI